MLVPGCCACKAQPRFLNVDHKRPEHNNTVALASHEDQAPGAAINAFLKAMGDTFRRAGPPLPNLDISDSPKLAASPSNHTLPPKP